MTHLRKMMLEELQRRNYAETTIDCYIRAVEDFSRRFHLPPDRLGPRHIREYQAELFQKQKLATIGGSSILLHQNSQEGLESGRHSLPENGASLTDDLESGRSRATNRFGSHSLASHSADDSLCHRTPTCRTRALKSERHRQSAHGDSRPRR